ncbi:MAG: hypothetical protein NTZ09_17665 [Candidatus Hydrogenedentes bacterium]|nr:hypothetical protein [Candidatus Hydrogenedentota bacterium]
MRKEGAANKGMLVLVGLILVAVVATVVILQRGKAEPLPVEPPAAPAPAPAPVTPIVEAPAPVEAPTAAVEEPPAAPAPEQPAEAAPAEPPKEPLNARTLAGTKWKPDFPTDPNQGMMQGKKLEIEFAPDGTWRINDQVRAKWAVEGKRVKIFDDKGEVHYLDIVGDKLMFGGEEIQRAN